MNLIDGQSVFHIGFEKPLSFECEVRYNSIRTIVEQLCNTLDLLSSSLNPSVFSVKAKVLLVHNHNKDMLGVTIHVSIAEKLGLSSNTQPGVELVSKTLMYPNVDRSVVKALIALNSELNAFLNSVIHREINGD